ncbi:hypothetical protein GIB67_031968 [Kingdonia uniflora]|uniref:Ig-like domain-containing protein n=1 Tax=Kingdonia uniflora TaxID=39325 RepID=A0A7J7NU33_9MAGN|nr:hypothetical protein GIB67_031968 [Kingdonia uniflora]
MGDPNERITVLEMTVSTLTCTVGELVEQLRLTNLALDFVLVSWRSHSKKKGAIEVDGDKDILVFDDSSDPESVKEHPGSIYKCFIKAHSKKDKTVECPVLVEKIRQCERLDLKTKTTSVDDYVAKTIDKDRKGRMIVLGVSVCLILLKKTKHLLKQNEDLRNTNLQLTNEISMLVKVKTQVFEFKGMMMDIVVKICACRSVSTEVFSDLTIEVEGVKYLPHKFPLLSKCLRLQELCSKFSNSSHILLKLLKVANIIGASSSSKIELTKRAGMQLEEARVNDLLIPSLSNSKETLYDVDIVMKISLRENLSNCPSSSKDSRREFVKDKRLQIASDDDKKINGEDDRCAHHANEDQNYQNIQEKLVDEDGESSEEVGEFNPDKHIDRPLDSHDNPDNGKCILSHHPFVEKGECSKENLLESVDKSDWAENNSQLQTRKGNSDRHRDLKKRRSVFDDEGSSDEDSKIVKDDQDSKQRKRKLIMSDVSDEEGEFS